MKSVLSLWDSCKGVFPGGRIKTNFIFVGMKVLEVGMESEFRFVINFPYSQLIMLDKFSSFL